ncbi:hypothetical protein BDV98DRAFT_524103 [Pterulicium gracile]|uniref:LysM domain-containing protein n=1 Tax=Pterulicium gracile TaxID=1884261 RepID=A0A5C3QV79_9AGAR|nr:hypothetical protein BDV98DRAFT_524103 [Pterula gracilis]
MFKFSALLSLVVAYASAVTLPLAGRQSGACAREYTVAPGDACNKISAAQNVSTFQLAWTNPTAIDQWCSNLRPEQVLCLGKEGKDCTDVHVVEAGDGCWAIYTGAGIPAETFFANNPNVARTCHNIYPGEVLCVASEVFDYST